MFSTDGTLISASAAPYCGMVIQDHCENHNKTEMAVIRDQCEKHNQTETAVIQDQCEKRNETRRVVIQGPV